MEETTISKLLPVNLLAGNTTIYIAGTLLLAVILHFVIQFMHMIYRQQRDKVTLKDFHGPKPHWLYGNINTSSFGQAFLKRVELAKQYGPAQLTHIGYNYRQVTLTSPEFIQSVMGTAEPKDPVGYRLIRPWIGDGLLISQGKKWARNRRLLTPAFHFDILKPYQILFSECANVMNDKFDNMLKEDPERSIEMFEHVSLMTLSSLMKCIFGINKNFQTEGKRNPYIKSVYDLSDYISRRFRNPIHHNDLIYYFTQDGYGFRQAYSIAQKFTKDVINKKKGELKQNGSIPTDKKYMDFMDMLLECRDANGNGLTNEEIQAEVDTFMFEGHDTTASGISWCLYNLAKHPEYQEKCRQEINQVLGDKDQVDWEDLSKLNFVTMCLKESLRTHPPVPSIGRITTREHKLPDGRIIPQGIWVGLGIYACHHDPRFWQNPEIYDPYRFTSDEVRNRHSYAFIPFSAGPRNCIGQNFAMNEMKTIISLVVKKFYLSLDETRSPYLCQTLVLRSKGGVWLKCKPT